MGIAYATRRWSRDEIILLLDAYVTCGLHPDSDVCDNLSQILRGMHDGVPLPKGYRSPGSVYTKCSDFFVISQNGQQRGNRLTEQEVWDEFHSNPDRLKSVANIIKLSVSGDTHHANSAVDNYDQTYVVEAAEGAIVTRMHRDRERCPQLVRKRKALALRNGESLSCTVCGFSYEARYGERGAGFIECHHTRPLHEMKPGEKTKLTDLALLCANCHRMIHSKRPWLSIANLRNLLKHTMCTELAFT